MNESLEVMASTNKKSWKIQDFIAHEQNVNCLALGHKSGRVLVTGSDDKKVNLWAVGKSSCFMSLSGHVSPIECVQFNYLEEQVCAGSRLGALKVWDLEAAKLLRTLTGHKYAIKSIDFHPNGVNLVSGSVDSCIKIWDSRKKGSVVSYEEHKSTVNSLKFSPDGNWVASGGNDATVKIWDWRIGRVLKEFKEHSAPVTSVQFHPHEFLLASGGKDRSVHVFDLENFVAVSSESDAGSVRCLWFHPDGECLFAGSRDYLKVMVWEPSRVLDNLFVDWGRVADLSSTQNQVIGASFHLTNVQVYITDLTKVQPFTKSPGNGTNLFTPHSTSRRSFSKAERPISLKPKVLSKTIEESTSGTDPEEDGSSANITNLTDYNEIFKGRSITRTPPPLIQETSFQEPKLDYSDPTQPQKVSMMDSFETPSLDETINNYRNNRLITSPSHYHRSKSNLDQLYENNRTSLKREERENFLPSINKTAKTATVTATLRQKQNIQRQISYQHEDVVMPKNNFNIKQSLSEANLSRNNNHLKTTTANTGSRRSSFSRSNRNAMTKIPNINSSRSVPEEKSSAFICSNPNIYNGSEMSPDEAPDSLGIVPTPLDKPIGYDIDDFLPKNQQVLGFQQQSLHMSEAEVLGVIMRGHESMMNLISTRQRSLELISAHYRNKDMKAAVELTVAMDDLAVLVDVLSVLNEGSSRWKLDLCVCVLPKIEDLLKSKFEPYIMTGCTTLKLILRHFGPVIKSNIQSSVGSFGVDLSREERYQKSVKCHQSLLSLRPLIVKKMTAPGKVGVAFTEVNTLMETTLD